jgi:hypothetical protein
MRSWWHSLADELQSTGRFDAKRVTARALAGRFYAGRAISVRVGMTTIPRITAYAALWPTPDEGWYEFEVMKCETSDAESAVYDGLAELVARVPEGKRIFFVSDDSKLFCRAARCGFTPANSRILREPLKWASRVNAVCKLPPSIHETGHPTPGDGERWLFIR